MAPHWRDSTRLIPDPEQDDPTYSQAEDPVIFNRPRCR
jgi:hypothetical protein